MLFQIYGDGAGWQLLGWVLVFAGLVLANEFARRTKIGGLICFGAIPAILTVYFIAIYICAANGAEWALNNDTYVHMTSWFHYAKLYAATAGCIGFMMLKPVCANVDFYSGFVYTMLNIPEELFTPLFAIARITGWSAHRLEELLNAGKIIRPAYKYVGQHTEFHNRDDRN